MEVGLLADEALVVLGPWLDALTSRRPRVGWVFESGPDGPRPCPEELLSRSGLRSGTDAVLHADGRAEETISGAHGPAAFALPHSVAVDDPAGALAALYAAGVRSLVLHGGPELAEPFLKQQLVDAVDVFLPVSAVSAPGQPVPVLPPDFQIRSVTWLDSGLFVQAERPESA